jgi:hypothetical protein
MSLALAVLFSSACAKQETPPLSAGLDLQKYRSIAVRSTPYTREEATFVPPVKGAGAGSAQGAGEGTAAFLGGCAVGSGGILLLFCIALTPVATITGAMVGAGASHSVEEVTSATASLKDALKKVAPAKALELALVKSLRSTERASYDVRALSKSEAKLTNNDLAKLGFDAVVDVKVSNLDLAVFGRIDPDASVTCTATVTVHDTVNRSASLPLSWTYQSNRYGYFDLAKKDARLLRRVFDESYEKIVAMIVNDLNSNRPAN